MFRARFSVGDTCFELKENMEENDVNSNVGGWKCLWSFWSLAWNQASITMFSLVYYCIYLNAFLDLSSVHKRSENDILLHFMLGLKCKSEMRAERSRVTAWFIFSFCVQQNRGFKAGVASMTEQVIGFAVTLDRGRRSVVGGPWVVERNSVEFRKEARSSDARIKRLTELLKVLCQYWRMAKNKYLVLKVSKFWGCCVSCFGWRCHGYNHGVYINVCI